MASVLRGSGDSSFGGNLSIEGVLTYEDVTSIDSVGVITARSGIEVTGHTETDTLNVSGISTAGSLVVDGNVSSTTQFSGFDGLRIHNNNGSAFGVTADMYFTAGTSTNNRGAAIGVEYNSSTSGNDLYFATNGSSVTSNDTLSERLRITSSGNVGIGTDDPQTLQHLKSDDPTIRIQRYNQSAYGEVTADTAGKITFKSDPGNAANGDGFSFTVNNSEKVSITSDGELLLGGHTSGPSGQTPKIEAREDGTSNAWRALINSSNDTADKCAFLGIYETKPGVFAHDRDMTAWNTLYLNTIDPLTVTNGGDVYTGGKFAIGTDSPSGYTFVCEKRDASSTTGTKNLVAKFVNAGQNTLELNMYGGATDQVQFAATNQEQTLSFLTGVNTSNVDSTEVTLLMTQSRDLWNQGPSSGTTGGALFIGREASPYGNLCAVRDSNQRPMIYMGGQYPEITLAHTVTGNSRHGPTIRFAPYIQSTNTAVGNQFVIGTNGSGTQLDIGHAVAAQNANVHNGIDNYNGTTRFRVTTSGCQVTGSLSKSSGSFRIDHPLAELSTTHDLVHSFLEGPQADLIYRGVVDLVDGTATVNIDTAGRMTEGTFEILCTNVSCFTSNETDWTAVKGSVSGNILTITAQDNTSTATVSWMVVGERKDPHMIDTDWTDENGRVITEPKKTSY